MTDLFWGCPSEMLLLVCKRDALDHCSGKPFFLVFCLPIPLIPTSPLPTPACVRKDDRGITGNGEMSGLFCLYPPEIRFLLGKIDKKRHRQVRCFHIGAHLSIMRFA